MVSRRSSILAYATIIGWLIAYAGKEEHDEFTRYHMCQALGVHLTTLCYITITGLVFVFSASVALTLSSLGIVLLLLPVFGIIHACNETKRPLPFIGRFFENKFSFIK
ncbi:MAG TPA: DUF4870 domain-containing protein [Niabella sp.]